MKRMRRPTPATTVIGDIEISLAGLTEEGVPTARERIRELESLERKHGTKIPQLIIRDDGSGPVTVCDSQTQQMSPEALKKLLDDELKKERK